MNSLRTRLLIGIALAACCIAGHAEVPERINYQGRLLDDEVPVNDAAEVIFRLYDAPGAASLLFIETQTVDVVDGFYSAQMGASNGIPGALSSALTHSMVYLEIEINDKTMSPRERILSVPYALNAATATDPYAVRTEGDTMTGALTNQNSITAAQYFNSNNTTTGQDALTLGGAHNTASGTGAFIAGGSNHTAIGNSAFIGGGDGNTAGDSAMDRHIVIAGGTSNSIIDHHSTIAGGRNNRISQEYSFIGGGFTNTIDNTYSVIGGGRYNWIRARDNVIGGGGHNLIDSGDIFSFIGGGESNKIYNDRCAIAGGRGNVASNIYVSIGGGDMNFSCGDSGTIGGGWTNYMGSSDAGTIAGGRGNKIYNNCDYSIIAGGRGNTISNSADYAFAGGYGARVNHDGTFVWADHNTSLVNSTAENQFMVRASGGFIFYSANNTTTGARLAPGSGSWSSLSDRNAKREIRPLDGKEVLEKLGAMPIYTWHYKDQASDIRHAGPMAQDFFATFGLGEDAQHISMIDPDGIALSAIQGLYGITRKENSALKRRIGEQNSELEMLRTRVTEMEHQMQKVLQTVH